MEGPATCHNLLFMEGTVVGLELRADSSLHIYREENCPVMRRQFISFRLFLPFIKTSYYQDSKNHQNFMSLPNVLGKKITKVTEAGGLL